MSEGRGEGGAKSEIVVVSALKDWSCVECGSGGGLLTMEERGPLCLDCADLGHLVYLPAGDAALTRRARKASGLSAVVVRFSRARRRYERQGILVEEPALEQAEAECLADAEAPRAGEPSPRRAGSRVSVGSGRGDPPPLPRLPARAGRGDRPPRGSPRQRAGGPQRCGAGDRFRRARPCRRRLGPPPGHAL